MKLDEPDGGRAIRLFGKEPGNNLIWYGEKTVKENHPISKSYNF